MEYINLLIGFILLIKGADLFVDGASSIAKIFKVPSILIGLTIVAFGTSSPEAAVSINAVLKNSNAIAVGNIVGSSIFNILLIVGISAIINPMTIKHQTILKELPFLLLSSIVLYVLCADTLLQGFSHNNLSTADGIILLSLFSIFMYYIIEMAILSKDNSTEEVKKMPMRKSIIFIILGIIGILIGSNFIVSSSQIIALRLGMSETLIGLTIVAVGTSLPELVTSITASIKGENDIAIGNAIGSNVFNILFILGITSLIKPIPVESKVFFDLSFLVIGTIFTFLLVITKKQVSRIEGILLSIPYIGYMIYIISRN